MPTLTSTLRQQNQQHQTNYTSNNNRKLSSTNTGNTNEIFSWQIWSTTLDNSILINTMKLSEIRRLFSQFLTEVQNLCDDGRDQQTLQLTAKQIYQFAEQTIQEQRTIQQHQNHDYEQQQQIDSEQNNSTLTIDPRIAEKYYQQLKDEIGMIEKKLFLQCCQTVQKLQSYQEQHKHQKRNENQKQIGKRFIYS